MSGVFVKEHTEDFKSRLLKYRYPEIFAQLHPTLNQNTNIDNITYGSKKRLWWICHICGENYQTLVINKSKGTTHRKCAYLGKHSSKKIWTTEYFIRKSKETHNDKFDYSEVKYTTQRDKIILTCNSCNNRFSQRANSHLQGSGCRNCAIINCTYFKRNH
jgi:protein-arginine kinase activator protein McsA